MFFITLTVFALLAIDEQRYVFKYFSFDVVLFLAFLVWALSCWQGWFCLAALIALGLYRGRNDPAAP